MNTGIFNRLLLSMILLFLISTSIIAYSIISETRGAYEKARLHQAHTMAEAFAEASLDALVVKDYELIEGTLRASSAIDDFAYAYLSKSTGQIITHSDLSQVALQGQAIGEIKSALTKKKKYHGRDVIEVIHPAYLGKKHLANAHLAYYSDKKSFNSETILLRVLAILVIILLLLSFATFFILRMSLKPLEKLASVMQSVTLNEDFSARVSSHRNDETGLLVKSFNNMLEHIEKRDLQLMGQKQQAEELANNASKYAQEVELTNRDLENEITERIRIESRLTDLSETLEQRVNERTKKLEEMNKIVVDISRSAGMAEVASGVLHNVGNVLNSVNISTSVIRQQLQNSGLNNLSKVVSLLEENKYQLAEFITEDEKGKQIPGFLKLLADKLQDESSSYFLELDNLDKNITHIKNIIRMQQSYAGNFGVSENVLVADLIDDALRVNKSEIEQSNIKIIKNYQSLPMMKLDKHKVLQVIINLIKNSIHAISSSELGEKSIKVVLFTSHNQVKIEVIDSGIGISKDDLLRIFEYGFTKKQGGHGFGLHNCALLAKDLDGELVAASEGLGKGATFSFSFNIN